ncbi:MAG: signal recognition particle-docking protein FtsY [Ruminococcaceae bacterium]|nr:signal recognition particle-docking protein FtsY [Oscillospiraceae bacterium]
MGLFDKFKKKKQEDITEQEETLNEAFETEEAPVEDTAFEEAYEDAPEESDNAPEQEEEAPEEYEKAEEVEAPEEYEKAEEVEAPEPKKEGFFEKLKNGLKKTKDGFLGKIELLMNSFTKIDEDFFEELEEMLILSDIGAETSCDICDKLRSEVKRTGATDPSDVKQLLRDIIAEILTGENELKLESSPAVIMVIGVNGAGKTTTIGKLAANLKAQGKRVIVAAADTFRAAAIDQLNVWTDRAGVEIVKHSEGSDPAAVVFDAINAAKARNADVVLCDTAGRLHNKKNLMEELKKIARVITRELPDASIETLLVLDATTGQNAVNQAKLFSETAEITGIALTKLDGTAKGGIIIPIKNELGIPVKLVGVGEKIDDLQPFVPADYVNALFE